jgi:CRP-like cAMP-binding protein
MNPLAPSARNIRQLKKLPLLQAIDEERWQILLAHITFTELDEGEFLFAAGGKSENLYVVVDGEICLFLPGSKSGEAFYLH